MRTTLLVLIGAMALLVPMTATAGASHGAVDLLTAGTAAAVSFNAESPDGSVVLVTTQQSLSADDTDASGDVYRLAAGVYTLVSDRVQAGPDGAAGVTFLGASPDLTRVFFLTKEAIVGTDGDAASDVYVREAGTTTLLSDRIQAGADAEADAFGVPSADGSRVFLLTTEPLLSGDADGVFDIYQRVGTTTTLISDRVRDGADAEKIATPAGASHDGSRVFFHTEEPLVDADGDASLDVYEFTAGTITIASDRVRLGPDQDEPAQAEGVSADGSRVFFVTHEPLVAADDDNAVDVYEHSGGTNRLRSDRVQAGADEEESVSFKAASEDGSRVFFQTHESVVSEDDDGGGTDVFERAANVTTLVSVGDTGNNLGFAGLTPDGTRVFLHANGPLGDDDDDTNIDLYERAAGATTLLSDRIQPGDDADENAFFAGTSADGSRVFFNTDEPLVATDGDGGADLYERSAGVTTPLSDRVKPGADGEFDAELVGASADGTRVYLRTEEQLTDGDSDAVHDLYVARVAPPPPPDGDGDGVPDSTDACPDVAANTADGCPPPPPDGDGDGVPDSTDACPDVAATTADGCPPPDPDPDPDPDPVVPTNPDAPSDPIVPPGPGDPTGPFEPLGPGAPLGPAGPRGPTDGDDLLNGTPAADRICGLLGNDTINGLAGNDTLAGDACGGRGRGGNDTLKGGAGRDRLIGGAGVNKYDGGPGNDTISARNGRRETVNCGAGGRDSATVDANDRVKGCERVRRPRRR